ncbi:MAG: hypothetical protein NTW44_06080 [Nitrospirae bacterium]|nr:hypothetical protein [Nitrospirota bacterium]
MKRFLMIMLAVAMVMSAATAFADVKANSDITLSGEIRVRALTAKDMDLYAPTPQGDGDANITAIKIKMEAKVEKVKAVIELQTGPAGFSKWGTVGTPNNELNPTLTGFNDFQNADASDLYFRQSYLAFPLMGVNVSIGHQLLFLGEKSFFDAGKDGAAAIVLTYPFGKKDAVGIGTIKVTDNGVYTPNAWSGPTGNDKNFHFAFASIDLGGHTLGLNIADMHDSIISRADLYNWGLTLSGKVLGAKYTLVGDVQSGKQDGVHKNEGYHASAMLDIPVSAVSLNLRSNYYSGEKDGDEVKKFVTYLEDLDYLDDPTHYDTFVWGYFTRAMGTQYGQGVPDPGGFWFNRIAADYKVTKDLNLKLAYINIKGTYGKNAQFAGVCSKKVADEVDFMLTYTIAKNLTWWFQTGYLMPSKAYKEKNTLATDPALLAINTLVFQF